VVDGWGFTLYLGKVCTKGTVGRRGSWTEVEEGVELELGEVGEVGERGEGEASRVEIGTIRSFLAGTCNSGPLALHGITEVPVSWGSFL